MLVHDIVVLLLLLTVTVCAGQSEMCVHDIAADAKLAMTLPRAVCVFTSQMGFTYIV